MKKLIAFFVIFSILFVNMACAQHSSYADYKTSLGVKFYPGGITLKHTIANGDAIEGLAYFWNGTRFTGLYELHYDIEGLNGLRWYVGPGFHFASYDSKFNNGATAVGIDGVLGLDLKFKNVPLNFSLDWQPTFDLGLYSSFYGGYGGLSIRYVLK